MKLFPSRTRARRSMPRTVVVSRRGGAAANGSGSALGDQNVYVASVPNGKADLLLGFVGGVAQTLAAAGPRGLELFNYAPGPSGAFTGGFGWDGPGTLVTPQARRTGTDTFETYEPGAVTGDDLTNGTDWNGSAVLHAY